ncbi:MAG: HAMP domain-containing histidine kinase [Euzebyales bacterium]|nr:HAMP domain-containing histidine kinase [Euzebyales bacterium]
MPAVVARAFSVLPRGNSLDDRTWELRHRVLSALLIAVIPAVVAVGVVTRTHPSQLVAEVLALAAAAAVAVFARRRGLRAGAATLGLVGATAGVIHFTGGMMEAHFLYFVLLGFVALYQDWRPYLLAVGFVLVSHGILGAMEPRAVFTHSAAMDNPWRWTGIHAGLFFAACVAHVIFWKFNEREQDEARRYYGELYAGERALVEQLRETQQLKSELISVVGHEFRTPLTSISGFARTLSARIEEMDPKGARVSANAIERQAKRLTRMVANLLTASGGLDPVADARADLREVADEVISELQDLEPAAARDIMVDIPSATVVGMSEGAAYQVLFNLADNAVKFADHQTSITLGARREGDEVVVEVANVGPVIPDSERERIFEAFVQADSSETRRYGGIGLGLHIVRKVVEAHGGRVDVYCESPVVIFRVWLPAAGPVGADEVASEALPVE